MKTKCIVMMANEDCAEIVSFMTPRAGLDVSIKSSSENSLFLEKLLLYFGGWFRETWKDSFDDVQFDSYCINRLYCSSPLPLLIFIYSIMGLLICKY